MVLEDSVSWLFGFLCLGKTGVPGVGTSVPHGGQESKQGGE